jgi:hypothetical protein
LPVVAAAVTVASVGDVDELARAWMTPATADWANSGIKEIKERMLIVEPPADEILFKDCGVNFQDWISWVRPSKRENYNGFKLFYIPPHSIMAERHAAVWPTPHS